jgi:tRNA(fMet)-specific endonuclease VapC
VTRYVLDTDTCIYWLNGDKSIEAHIVRAPVDQVSITSITECELYYGAFKSARVAENLKVLERLRATLSTIHTTSEVAPIYGAMKASLEKQGRRLDDADMLIASCAMAAGAVLVTNNTKHFRRIDGLTLERWRRP